MSEKDSIQTKWDKTRNEVLTTAKWLKRGTLILVDAKQEPMETTIDGQWGKRNVYIIGTTDYGLIYVTPVQLVRIAKLLEQHNYKNTTINL